MRRCPLHVAVLLGGFVLSPMAMAGEEKPAPKPPPRPPAVAKSHYGSVSGQVYDVVTRLPVKGARVIAQDILEFPDKGNTTGQTDELGKYKIQARLGRQSWKMNIGKAFLGALLGVYGAGSEETKRIDVCQLNVRVTKEGYKAFEGPLPVRSADAMKFSVTMEPVLLAPQGAEELSGVGPGWGVVRIRRVLMDPPVLRAGSEGKVKVLLWGPAELLAREKNRKLEPRLTIVCTSGPPFCIEASRPKGVLSKFTPKTVEREEEGMLYVGRFKIDKKSKVRDEVVRAEIQKSPFDIAAGGDTAEGILQVATDSAEQELAQLRVEAHEASLGGDNALAAEKMRQACERRGATYADYRRLAAYAEAVHDYAGAAEAMKKALQALPKEKRVRLAGEYGRLLIEAGRYEDVLDDVVPLMQTVPKKSRVKDVPIDAVAGVGLAYLRLGNLEKAQASGKELAEWSKSAKPTPFCAEFRRELRLAAAEAEAKAKPEDPQALAEYGRTLMDFGRWDEALQYLTRALQLKPEMMDLQWDLHYARMQMERREAVGVENLEEALKAAEAAVAPLGGGKGKTKDFFAWHRLALLLYRKACLEREKDPAAAQEILYRARDALIEAITCARSGTTYTESGMDETVAITGYAFEEANYDYVLMDSLDQLVVKPEDRLANFNLAWALCSLKQYDLAVPVLEQCARLWPDFPEVKYLTAQVALWKGERAEAVKYLQEFVKATPWHPRANLLLAEIFTEEGDMASAAGCLAAHAAWYGTWRPAVSAW